MRTVTRSSIGAAAAAAILLAGATPALADVERRGTCTASSTWEADIEREGRYFELDFEVNTQTPDEDWRLVVARNGKRIYSDTRPATRDYDDRMADVDWSLVARNKSGVRDSFTFTATNQVSGQRCQVTLRV